MALVVFCMKFFTLNVSKKLSIHFSSTFYIFKTFSGTRAIQRTLNRVFAMRQTQANVDKSVKNVKFCSYVAYLIAYGAICISFGLRFTMYSCDTVIESLRYKLFEGKIFG